MLRLLLVEDMEVEAQLAVRQLDVAGIPCDWHRVETEDDLREELQDFKPDLIISDFSLPRFDGMSALTICAAAAPETPFIFVSGTIGEERAIDALKRGAVDYVLKGNLARLAPAVNRAMDEARSRRARRAAEERVARLMRIMQMISSVNAAVVRIHSRAELLQEVCRITHRVGAYAQAMFVIIEPGKGAARTAAFAGVDGEHLKPRIWALPTPAHEVDQITRTLSDAEQVICHSLEAMPGTPTDRDRLAALGIRSTASLPLLIDGTPVGAFWVSTTESETFDHEELAMLQELTANVSFALQYLQKHETVQFLSYFDPLTDLAKRDLFCERLTRIIEHVQPPALAVAVLDIERLSAINDTLGRHIGDQLLECVADRLKRHLVDSNRLASLGGGTFAALIDCETSSGTSVRAVSERIAEIFARPIALSGRELPVSVRAGVARFPHNGRDAHTLLQNAEAALRIARDSGERYVYHRQEMNAQVAERLAIEHRLRSALDNQQFLLHYQPKIEIASGRIIGLEALLRWADPARGVVAPADFLDILESSGMIVPVGEWVLQQAATDFRRLLGEGRADLRIAVNISPQQLRAQHFAAQFLRVAPPAQGAALDIEIVESALLGDPDALIRQLQQLREAGVRISIDDFGTGYSSLSRLAQLPIDMLKIDRSFTQLLGVDRASDAVVATIVQLAGAFRMATCAEGVETDRQLDILRSLRCDQAQGYLTGRPAPLDELWPLMAHT